MLEIPAVRRIRSSRPASATEWIQDQPELPDTLYKRKKKKRKRKNADALASSLDSSGGGGSLIWETRQFMLVSLLDSECYGTLSEPCRKREGTLKEVSRGPSFHC